MTKEFIQQTALDYDIPTYLVEKIIELYPNTFYEELEKILQTRQKTQS